MGPRLRGCFASLDAARDWVESFVRWYSKEHRYRRITCDACPPGRVRSRSQRARAAPPCGPETIEAPRGIDVHFDASLSLVNLNPADECRMEGGLGPRELHSSDDFMRTGIHWIGLKNPQGRDSVSSLSRVKRRGITRRSDLGRMRLPTAWRFSWILWPRAQHRVYDDPRLARMDRKTRKLLHMSKSAVRTLLLSLSSELGLRPRG